MRPLIAVLLFLSAPSVFAERELLPPAPPPPSAPAPSDPVCRALLYEQNVLLRRQVELQERILRELQAQSSLLLLLPSTGR